MKKYKNFKIKELKSISNQELSEIIKLIKNENPESILASLQKNIIKNYINKVVVSNDFLIFVLQSKKKRWMFNMGPSLLGRMWTLSRPLVDILLTRNRYPLNSKNIGISIERSVLLVYESDWKPITAQIQTHLLHKDLFNPEKTNPLILHTPSNSHLDSHIV